MGRLEVRRLDPDARGPFESTHLRVLAEGVPMAAFAGALSEALGVPVVVDETLVGTRVALALPDVEISTLWRHLANEQQAYVSLYNRTIHFVPEPAEVGALDHGPPPPPEVPPLETHVVTPLVDPAQFASAFCAQIASPRGAASVVGTRVLLTDVPDRLRQAERLAGALPK